MNEANTLARGRNVLGQRLPPGWTETISRSRQRRQADVILRLLSPDGVEGSVRVEVKPRLVPRDAPELKRRLEGLAADSALVMTEFLTPNAKRRLTEEGLNYLDLTGNVRLILSRPGSSSQLMGRRRIRIPPRRPAEPFAGRGRPRAAPSVISHLRCRFQTSR